MKKITLSIAGMSCQGCANTVNAALAGVRARGAPMSRSNGDGHVSSSRSPRTEVWNNE